MNDKKARVLVVLTAVLLLFSGAIMFYAFDRQGMDKHKTNNYVNYSVSDYIDVSPVVYNTYNDVYSSINVSRVDFKELDSQVVVDFANEQEKIISYITGYYDEIKDTNDIPSSSVVSSIKSQINTTILSVFYRLDFNLNKNVFNDNIKSYVVTLNIDLGTNKVLTEDDMLLKYNYTKKYIAEKLFNEDVLIESNQIVIDKDTNMSLTKSDIERKKSEYIERIILDFDNIIEVYIENNSLVLVYDTKELRGLFFDNDFETNVKFRYLK